MLDDANHAIGEVGEIFGAGGVSDELDLEVVSGNPSLADDASHGLEKDLWRSMPVERSGIDDPEAVGSTHGKLWEVVGVVAVGEDPELGFRLVRDERS